MPFIKRYPNRKLYDTEAKQYITLEEIAALIRSGAEVHVVDHSTGEDLTALTLTQIIFEQEKKQGGFLPRSLLSGLIQAGGESFSAIQRGLAASLGFWRQVDEEIERRIDTLTKSGELTLEQGRDLLQKLIAPEHRPPGQEQDDIPLSQPLRESDIERLLEQRQIPTRSDLQRLLDELDQLAEKIEDLDKSQG
jgi:polyhydroxyalkanoate synthesis repressor PhaR